MADYFASIFGTEKDKVNCSFYFKIGACRHGDRCSRVHNKPSFSQTILLQNLYENPRNSTKSDGEFITDEEDQQHFDEFFEDIFVELEEKYGHIEEMNVCDNLGDHLIGNVYVKFKSEEDAERAVEQLNERWFGGKPVYAELSTVTDFREAGCRQYEINACTRGGFCNFMHLKQISHDLRRHLFGSSKNPSSHRPERRSHRSPVSRSRSRSRSVSVTRHKSSRRRRHRSRKSSRRSPHHSSRHRSPTNSRSRSPVMRPSASEERSAPSRSHAKLDSSSRASPREVSPGLLSTAMGKSPRGTTPQTPGSHQSNHGSNAHRFPSRSRSRSRSMTPPDRPSKLLKQSQHRHSPVEPEQAS